MVELARPLLCKWAKYKDQVVIVTGKSESATDFVCLYNYEFW
jgi:hypothetical protein